MSHFYLRLHIFMISLMETTSFSSETQRFRLETQIYIEDPKLYIKDPKCFNEDHKLFYCRTHTFHFKPPIFIGDPRKSWCYPTKKESQMKSLWSPRKILGSPTSFSSFFSLNIIFFLNLRIIVHC